jgi:hypothetical protein
LTGSEPRYDETVADLAQAIGGESNKFIRLCLIKDKDALGPEGATINGGVEDVNGGLRDGTLGGGIDTKWNPEGEG